MDQNSKMWVPLSIIVAGIVIAGAIVYSKGGGSIAGTTPPPNPPAAAADTVPPTIDDDVVLGEADAPVTVIAFGDYECPFCGQFFQNVEGKLRDEYVKTGKVRMVYRDFPLSFHPNAQPAAEASECAKEQGKFWAYHDGLFSNQDKLGAAYYTSLAQDLGLNMTQFKSCVDTSKYADEIAKDYQDGSAAGVDGTPATFVNGTLISGAVPYETFKAAVEAELAK